MLKLIHMSIRKILTKLNNRNTCLFPKFSTLTWATIITFFILVGSFINHSLKAQETDIITQYAQTIEEGNPNLENWNSANMDNNILKTLDTLVGTKNIADSIEDPTANFIPGGAIGTTNNLIAALYTPPASGIQYLAQLKDGFLGKPAYAQGVGFVGLQPLLPIWRGFRNIVYILSSLIFVIMGLLIMFRIKTGPQSFITIQNAIPKIITTLILVTFSYAIAGLLIDFMNLIQGLVVAMLFTIQGKPSLTGNLIDSGLGATNLTFSKLSQPSLSVVYNLTYKILPMNTITALGALIGAIVGGIFWQLPGILIGAGIGVALFLVIIVIAVLIWQLKFFFGLVMVYVNVIIKIITAPLEIGLGAFPGIKIGFSSWITQLVANLAVFPISMLFLTIANVIVDKIQNNPLARGGSVWMPSVMNPDGNLVNFVTGISGGLPAAAIGLGTVFLMSKLPKMIPEFIFQIKPSPWGTAVGESTKGLTGPITTIGNISKSGQQIAEGISYGRGWKNKLKRTTEEKRARGMAEDERYKDKTRRLGKEQGESPTSNSTGT